MSNHFGVGFRREAMALFDEVLRERNVILDDAVMDNDNPPGAVAMGMGVLFRRPAVRGPASMANAICAIKRLEADDLFQVAQLAFGTQHLKTIAISADGYTGRVIAAVF